MQKESNLEHENISEHFEQIDIIRIDDNLDRVTYRHSQIRSKQLNA